MKTIILFFVYAIATIALSHCSKDPEIKKVAPEIAKTKHYEKPLFNDCPPTITQGLYGCCTYKTGNCMPIIDTNNCKWYGVKRTIFIYKATADSQAVNATPKPHIHSHWYSQINTRLVRQIQSDNNGCYQVELPVGQYTILIREIFNNNQYYCESWGSGYTDLLCPVTIDSNKITQRNLLIKMFVE